MIGTNKKDATETVELLLADHAAGLLPPVAATAADVDALLAGRGVEVVDARGLEAHRRRRACGGRARRAPALQALQLGRAARRRTRA